jgi:Cft2 family RNA processing exonuclease
MQRDAEGSYQHGQQRPPFTVFGEGDVRLIKSVYQRRDVIVGESPEPSVILAFSGMLYADPSVAYARKILIGERSALLTIGFQDKEDLGRNLRELEKGDTLALPYSLYGATSEVPVSCRVERFHLSSHADRAGLLNLISDYPSPRVIRVHDEGGVRHALYDSLR